MLLHRIALIQQVPDTLHHYPQEATQLQELAECLSPETVQLFYQIALHGKRDLSLAPDALAGLTMTLLRMLTFRPVHPSSIKEALPTVASPSVSSRPDFSKLAATISAPNPLPAKETTQSGNANPPAESKINSTPLEQQASPAPLLDATLVSPPIQVPAASTLPSSAPLADPEKTEATPALAPAPKQENKDHSIPSHSARTSEYELPTSNETWQTILHSVKASPMVRQLLLQSAWSSFDTAATALTLTLTPQHKHLLTFQKELSTALQITYGSALNVIIQIHDETDLPTEMLDTPAQRMKTAEREELAARVQAFSNDPFVQTVCEATGAQVDERTVRPVTPSSPTP